MSRIFLTLSVLFAHCVLFGAIGCSQQGAAPKSRPSDASQPNTSLQADAEIQSSLAKLPPQLQKLASTQRICPVSGKPLGSMDVPEAVDIDGRTVLICCAHCETALKSNPEKYLAKIRQDDLPMEQPEERDE